ncbi:malto-oligosyltrehalose synthase [Devosia sp.]|uniref:malto-oligosyltrehalose synthase n=1 Tax=Devosia sp. TaxID=1871048 RepID=UPI00262DBE0B|nr:malto-oligosyltrehalose synthase [Devosia sp.]
MITPAAVPRATYRLQLNKDFGFAEALALVPYLGRLGISHLYLSPILRARAGSTHGYDTVEHREINPELGTLDDFRRLATVAREREMGIILDFVPNHMGIGGTENAYWLDVLKLGQGSRYAHWFDIDWTPADTSLSGKVLVPVLGCSYGEALEQGRLVLKFSADTNSFAIWVDDANLLPLDPKTYPASVEVDAINADKVRLDQLVKQQHWRVARYSVAVDDINYRRFFIVNELAGIRIEEADVFDHTHALIFQLIDEGLVDGLRIDHIDGLRDPKAYVTKLREKSPRPIYLVVEKILAPHEQLRADWGVDGTTGYEFSAHLTTLGSDPAGEVGLSRAYEDLTDERRAFTEIELEAKLTIIDTEMGAELDRIATLARAIAEGKNATSDLTRNGLRNAIRVLVAHMPVYRSYVDGDGSSEIDRRNVGVALLEARRDAPTLDPAVFDFLADLIADPAEQDGLEFVLRLQQFTGPVMAKGLEDTALYRDNRMIALNDVGERPDRLNIGVAAFHDFNATRLAQFPHAMLTTSSHDTKRGEDTRARILTLSGNTDAWKAAVDEWTALLGPAAEGITRNELWYFFQMLVGAWPTEFPETGELPPAALDQFRQRLQAAMQKSVREARVNSSWTKPNESYETALTGLMDAALADTPDNGFLAAFRLFAAGIGEQGARIGLAQVVLKLTAPGVPDIYQGAELWEQSMVDPDNRRPVDFVARWQMLDNADAPLDIANWRDGSVKLQVIERLLRLRSDDPELFAQGSYEPVAAGDHIVAFLRRREGQSLLAAVALHPWIAPEGELKLPEALASTQWQDAFTGAASVPDSAALAALSVAVWRSV